MATTDQEYFESNSLGNYQYVSIKEIIDDIVLDTFESGSYLNNVSRTSILRKAVAGIKKLNFDKVIKTVKQIEIEIGNNTSMPLPRDFVSFVRLSVVGEKSMLFPLIKNTKANVSKSYLQDHEYEFIYDSDGFVIEANGDNVNTNGLFQRTIAPKGYYSAFIDTSSYGVNGDFVFDKENSVFSFSSNLIGKNIVLEYLSDGLSEAKIYNEDLKIHKHLEEALRSYIYYELIKNKRFNVVPMNEKLRAKSEFVTAKNRAKRNLNRVSPREILKAYSGSTVWL